MTTIPYQHLGFALATDSFFVREQFSDEQWDHFLRRRTKFITPRRPTVMAALAGMQLERLPSGASRARRALKRL